MQLLTLLKLALPSITELRKKHTSLALQYPTSSMHSQLLQASTTTQQSSSMPTLLLKQLPSFLVLLLSLLMAQFLRMVKLQQTFSMRSMERLMQHAQSLSKETI